MKTKKLFKYLSRRLVLAIVCFVLLIVAVVIVRSPSPFGFPLERSEFDATPTVAVAKAKVQSDYQFPKEFIGRVEARQQSTLGFELRGLLVEIAVDEGTCVEKGEKLARLDTKRLMANLKEAKAELQRSIAEARLADSTFERNKKALDVNAISEQELDEAIEEKETAEAQVEINRAKVETIEVDIEKSVLLSPFNGCIVRRFVDEGVVVTPGQQILQVQQSGPLDIRVGVTTEAAKKLSKGDLYSLKINGQDIPAFISAILPLVGESRTVDVIFRATMATPTVRPGDLARLFLSETIERRGFWVPIASLSEGRRGLWTVFVVQSDGIVSRRHVEVFYTDKKRAYVSGSVDDGELVAVDGTQKLVPGIKVNVIEGKDE